MGNLATSLMADICNYTRKLRGWAPFSWCMFSPQKWWVHGYELGWKAALQLAEGTKPMPNSASTQLKVGEFTIWPSTRQPDHYEIYHSSGEGGCFDASAFRAVVDKFYSDNF